MTPAPLFVISRFGFDDPRLIEVTSECPRRKRIHGRDLMRGGAAMVRAGDVIARHTARHEAMASYRALRAALPGLDAGVFQARAAYDRAVRLRLKAQAAVAAGRADAPAEA